MTPHSRFLAHLRTLERTLPNARFGIALSGGCDSAYLLSAMREAEIDCKAYIVRTAFQPEQDIADALVIAEHAHAEALVLDIDVFSHDDLCANPPQRCYLCKRIMFEAIRRAMENDGRTILADGTNLDDDPARRPGFKALTEYSVRSPLREAGMTKEDIRAASREMGIFTADKPNFSCWATRIPAGQTITPAALAAARAAHAPAMAHNS